MISPACRLGAFLLVLVVAGCGTSLPSTAIPPWTPGPGTPPPGVVVRVTLGIYSGREDPSWLLAADEVAALDRALNALPRAVGRPPEAGLGYRGFTIERSDGTLVAYGGAVAPPGRGERALLSDPARTIERLLLESARTHVAGNELAEVERSLAAP